MFMYNCTSQVVRFFSCRQHATLANETNKVGLYMYINADNIIQQKHCKRNVPKTDTKLETIQRIKTSAKGCFLM